MSLLKFTASWCGPCKKIQPIVEATLKAKELQSEYRAIDVETDSGLELSERFKVKGLPTFLWVDAVGAEVKRVIGCDEEKVVALFTEFAEAAKKNARIPLLPEAMLDL